MKGDTTLENEVKGKQNDTETAAGERRASLVALEQSLRRVSQSPFHKNGEFLSDLSASTRDAQFHLQRRGADEGSVKMSALYQHFLESSRNYNLEDVSGGPSEGGSRDAIVFRPPESSPVGFTPKVEAKENGAVFSDSPTDASHSHTLNPFRTSLSQSTPASGGHLYDIAVDSSGGFGTSPLQTQETSGGLGSDYSDLFQPRDLLHPAPAKGIDLLDQYPSVSTNPFTPSAAGNLFRPATADEDKVVKPTPSPRRFRKQAPPTDENHPSDVASEQKLDIFSPSSPHGIDPFPSPLPKTPFTDGPSTYDPFDVHSDNRYDPFKDFPNGTAGVFQPPPSKTASSSDLFAAASNATRPSPTSSLVSPSDTVSSSSVDLASGLSKAASSGSDLAVDAALPNGPNDQTASPSHGQSPEQTHVGLFRRPPKPLPRTRALRPEKPPKPANPIESKPTAPQTPPKPAFKPLPKPVIQKKPNIPDQRVDPDNDVAFEDVLLLGQECCVEDWPEDSPEFNPDFKPSGTLKLRRESLMVDSDEGRGASLDRHATRGSLLKKKKRVSLPSRRLSKYSGDMEERSVTVPQHKVSKDYFEERPDEEEKELDHKGKPLKTKINHLLRRASTNVAAESKRMNGHVPQRSRDDDIDKKSSKKVPSVRRWSEGAMLDEYSPDEDDGADEPQEGAAGHQPKKTNKVKSKFVSHRGRTNTLEKDDYKLKGAHGQTLDPEDKFPEFYGDDSPARKKSQDYYLEDVKKSSTLPSQSKGSMLDEYSPDEDDGADEPQEGAAGHQPKKKNKIKKFLSHRGRGQTPNKGSKDKYPEFYGDDSPARKKSQGSMLDEYSPDEDDGADEPQEGAAGHQPKKKNKIKKFLSHRGRGQTPNKGSKDKYPEFYGDDSPARKKSQAGVLDDDCCQAFAAEEAACGMEDGKPGAFAEDDAPKNRKASKSFTETYDADKDDFENSKPKKSLKLKGLKKLKAKHKSNDPDFEEPPGATSSDYFLSEAAQAEWRAAQKDERAAAGSEDEEEEGDTDSLMEWWDTVEQWDELPSDEEDADLKEDESKSFTILADKVHRGLRVFNKVFTENAEFLWGSIVTLHAIADDISTFHQKAKIAGITGGTTTAVGGATAIAGLALAPFTFGASLIITAVGVGVATAGGIASASAAISDNVNNMHDRKKVETVLLDYESQLLDLGKILHFVNHGLYKLRGHPFLRSGTQHYAEDWEIRRAVQMISLVDVPVMRATDITDTTVAAVQGLFKGMDNYFVKETRELKKSCKKVIVSEIKEVASVLNDGIVDLNGIREELQDAIGSS